MFKNAKTGNSKIFVKVSSYGGLYLPKRYLRE